jgi:hypothetical protein
MNDDDEYDDTTAKASFDLGEYLRANEMLKKAPKSKKAQFLQLYSLYLVRVSSKISNMDQIPTYEICMPISDRISTLLGLFICNCIKTAWNGQSREKRSSFEIKSSLNSSPLIE